MTELVEDSCEWMTSSYYQPARQCGRNAVRNIFGPSLCWQHADAAFAFVLNHFKTGHYGARPTEELAKAILNSGHFKPSGSSDRHPDIATFVEEQIIQYLECLVRDSERHFKPREMWWRREALYQIDRLIDQLLEKRINEKWGTD